MFGLGFWGAETLGNFSASLSFSLLCPSITSKLNLRMGRGLETTVSLWMS